MASERASLNIWPESTFGSSSSIFRRPSNNSSILQPLLAQTLPHNHEAYPTLVRYQQLHQAYGSAWAIPHGSHSQSEDHGTARRPLVEEEIERLSRFASLDRFLKHIHG
jgi:hypothetical protein